MNHYIQQQIQEQKILEKQTLSKLHLEQAKDLMSEWFKLHIEWIDKIWNFSITIIGVTVSIFLALKEKFSDTVCLYTFFWMWITFLIASIACFITRYCYSEVRFVQSHLWQLKSKKSQLEATIVTPIEQIIDSETWLNFTKEDSAAIKQNIQEYWKEIVKYWKKEERFLLFSNARYFAIGFFLAWMILLIFIGHDLIR